MTNGQGGLVLLGKPPGVTSFRALSDIKQKCRTSKIGHTGTLDKFAEGLLVVLTEGTTRLAQLFSSMDKVYRAVIRFGATTDTLDPEGTVVSRAAIPSVKRVCDEMVALTGDILQTPPRYSAVHVDGTRSYQRALRGERATPRPRKVTVYSARIDSFVGSDAAVTIHCSTGTYVRAFARDLGQNSGSCAYVAKLERIRVGPFCVSEAVSGDQFLPSEDVVPPILFMPRTPGVTSAWSCSKQVASSIRNGVPLRSDLVRPTPRSEGLYAVFDLQNSLIAVAAWDGTRFTYRNVFGSR